MKLIESGTAWGFENFFTACLTLTELHGYTTDFNQSFILKTLTDRLMATRDKYQNALNLAQRLGVRDLRIEDNDGTVRVWGTVNSAYEKDQIWNSIKSIGGDSPSDFVADFQVANNGYYAKHTVEKGESLSKIAKQYYGDMMDYKKIYNANRDVLDDPDQIEVGQVLTIPNP